MVIAVAGRSALTVQTTRPAHPLRFGTDASGARAPDLVDRAGPFAGAETCFAGSGKDASEPSRVLSCTASTSPPWHTSQLARWSRNAAAGSASSSPSTKRIRSAQAVMASRHRARCRWQHRTQMRIAHVLDHCWGLPISVDQNEERYQLFSEIACEIRRLRFMRSPVLQFAPARASIHPHPARRAWMQARSCAMARATRARSVLAFWRQITAISSNVNPC